MKMRIVTALILLAGSLPIRAETNYFSLRLVEYCLGLPCRIYDVASDSKGTRIRKAEELKDGWTIIFEAEGKKREIATLYQVLQSVEISSLEDAYINEGVFDGYEVVFEIVLTEGSKKVINVSNCFNPYFNEIINAVNKIYGEKGGISPFPLPSEDSLTIPVELTNPAEQGGAGNPDKPASRP